MRTFITAPLRGVRKTEPKAALILKAVIICVVKGPIW